MINQLLPSGMAAPSNGRPAQYGDYMQNAPSYGRGLFQRLRRMGAFQEGNPFAQYNPFLASNTNKYADVWSRFSSGAGPARQRPTGHNIYNAQMDYFDAQQPAHEAAYQKLLGDYNTSRGQGQGLLDRMQQPVISDAMLQQLQAAARDKVAREGANTYSDVAARLAGTGQSVDRANPAFFGAQANTAYQAGQSDIQQALGAAQTNYAGYGQAAGLYQGWLQNLLQQGTGLEQFRTSLGDQRSSFLQAWQALRAAGRK
jgi:hypothetical protein